MGHHALSNSPSVYIRLLLRFGRTWPFCRGQFRGWIAHTITVLSKTPLIADFNGAKFLVHNDGHATEHAILLYPKYNAAEIAFLLEALTDDGTAVDIGSNIGLYSLPMAVKLGGKGKVLSLDANAAFALKLTKNAEVSGLTNIVQEVIAVGDRYGTVSVMTVDGNPGTAIVAPGKGGPSVEMQPLKDILHRHGVNRIDAMKVDIDGSEEIALVPFLRNAPLELLPKRLVMEHIMLDKSDGPLPRALKTAGYSVVGTTKSNSLYQRSA